MRSIVCAHCKERARVTKPIIVPYIDRRSGERRSFFACWFCDSTELWPVYTRTSPTVPKDL